MPTTKLSSEKSASSQADSARHERDRYVAFAFAAADLLVETNVESVIVSATGAAQSIVGRSSRDLVGTPFEAIAAAADRTFVRRLFKRIRELGRIDPVPMSVLRPDGKSIQVLLGGCRLPNLPLSIFLSVTVLPTILATIAHPRDEATGLLSLEGLRETAEVAARAAGAEPARLKLLQLNGLSGATRQMTPDRIATMMEEIGAALRTQSIGGDSAGRLGDETFGIVTSGRGDDLKNDAILLKEIGDVFRGVGVQDGQIAPLLAKLDLSVAGLTDGDVSRGISYALNTFIKTRGNGFTVKSLAGGLAATVAETVTRIASTRRMIDEGAFSLVYQPVVRLNNHEIHHYEALSRFPGKETTFETICFSEDVGLIPALDMVVCARAIEVLANTPGVCVAVNLSGRSIQNETFRQSFGELVRPQNNLRGRLIFELTESAVVDELEDAANFLRWIRKLGHQVCLDDFGAGAAAYSYLRRFDVDFVKIDGPFLKAAVEHARERALIHSICVLCSEIGCSVIGEMIEDEKAAALATKLGITYGQGWLFGKPVADLSHPALVGRRKGSSETWG